MIERPSPPPKLRAHAAYAWLDGAWSADVRFGVGDDGRFVYVERGVAPAPGDQRLHCVLPGVPNLHSHTFQRAIVGRTEYAGADGDDFWSWREQMYRTALSLSPEAVEDWAYRSFVEMLEGGYTRVCEFHYLHNDERGRAYAEPAELSLRIVAAARRAGIRLCLLPVLYQYAGFGAQPPRPEQRRFILALDAYLRLVEDLRRHAATGGYVVGIAPHSLRAVDATGLRALAAWRAQNDARLPWHIHIAEQVGEVTACRGMTGRTPVDYLTETIALDAQMCLVHATHADAAELARVRAAEAVIALCPTTEANLGDGVFPLSEAHALGLRWGIGSDAQVSRRALTELRMLEYGQRLSLRRRCIVAPAGASTGMALYERATRNLGAVTGYDAGAVAVGALADFIDLPAAACLGDAPAYWLDRLIFDADLRPAWDVYVGGARVVEHGRHCAPA